MKKIIVLLFVLIAAVLSYFSFTVIFPTDKYGDKLSSYPESEEEVNNNILKIIKSSPLSEKEIINRVISGEDLQVIDLAIVEKNYQDLRAAFLDAKIYVAVKANTAPGIIDLLARANANFEVATIEEALFCFEKGINAERIIFSHPAKDTYEIREASNRGINTFVSDSMEDLKLISKYAKGAKVLLRIKTSDDDHETFKSVEDKKLRGFNSRFGVGASEALSLLKYAQKNGLVPFGLTFHVGTQSNSPDIWEQPIKIARKIFDEAMKAGIDLTVLDIGGGFPSRHNKKITPIDVFGKQINKYLNENFPDKKPQIIIEPGRSISAMAGITIGRVINVKPGNGESRIVTVSTGRFSAGIFGVGHTISFFHPQLSSLKAMSKKDGWPVRFYGKACASLDIPIEGNHLRIPRLLQTGDLAIFNGTGAYTTTMQTNWCQKSSPTIIVYNSSSY